MAFKLRQIDLSTSDFTRIPVTKSIWHYILAVMDDVEILPAWRINSHKMPMVPFKRSCSSCLLFRLADSAIDIPFQWGRLDNDIVLKPGRPTRLCTTVIETRIKVAQVIGLVIIRVIQHQRGQSGGHTLTKTFLDAIVTLLRLLRRSTLAGTSPCRPTCRGRKRK